MDVSHGDTSAPLQDIMARMIVVATDGASSMSDCKGALVVVALKKVGAKGVPTNCFKLFFFCSLSLFYWLTAILHIVDISHVMETATQTAAKRVPYNATFVETIRGINCVMRTSNLLAEHFAELMERESAWQSKVVQRWIEPMLRLLASVRHNWDATCWILAAHIEVLQRKNDATVKNWKHNAGKA